MRPIDVFQKHAGDDLPVDFLRALAFCESGFDPDNVNPSSHATGLFQITRGVVEDFNSVYNTKHALDDCRDPDFGAEVGAFHLRRIIARWNKSIPALKANFQDLRFVGLLVYGWNSGPAKVLELAQILRSGGVTDAGITPDAVYEAARRYAPDSFVAIADRMAWAKRVAATFADLRDRRAEIVAVIRRKKVRPSPAVPKAPAQAGQQVAEATSTAAGQTEEAGPEKTLALLGLGAATTAAAATFLSRDEATS